MLVEPLPATVFVNRVDPADDLHRRNVDWLSGVDGLAVETKVAALADRWFP